MKRKLKGVLAVALTLVMVLSLMVAFVPVATAADYEENDWKEWGLPPIEPGTDVGTIAVAPDGTLYAAVLEDDTWLVQKSEDDGYTWDDTELDDAGDQMIVDIAVSPNYADDETVYVGIIDGTVYRLEEAGEGDVIALKDIPDVRDLFSLDVWTDDDDYNWILVGTGIDVFVLKDKRFEDWRDQELNEIAYEVAFSPDFDDSEIIWAVTKYYDEDDGQWEFLVTSTVSPGQWGQEVGEVGLPVLVTLDVDVDVDLGFPDDYDSDPDSGDTNLWVAVSNGAGGGDIFLIEGVDAGDGDSKANAMFTEIGDEDPTDFISIAVSGDYGDEVILAGEKDSPTVWISDDGGYGWSGADKSPTGEGETYVIMEADVVWGGEVFDTDEGMAFASTWGDESAVSRANDGGLVYNQVGLIDTEIDAILDLGFHPDFPGTPTLIMLTEETLRDEAAYSLWLTKNGDSDEPDYVRVLCGYDGGAPGNFNGEFKLVEYSQNADAIYIWGEDDDEVSSIWKSTNDGQTFPSSKKRSVENNAFIRDWAITDDDTIYAATWDFGNSTDNGSGFYKTTNSGLSWTSDLVGTDLNDICLSPDFENDETIIIGGMDGKVYMSDDAGGSFDPTSASLTGDVYVAFDADYADEDADGYMLIYAAGDGDAIQEGEVSDTDDVDWYDLDDDANSAPESADCQGLVVAEDNALYCIDAGADKLDRLLLHESDSEWESAGVTDPFHLWITSGSNVLWTIDDDNYAGDPGLYVLEDTLSGQVTLDSPPDGYQSDRLNVIQISWDELRGCDDTYDYELDEASGLATDIVGTTDDTSVNVAVTASCEYDWKVRVAPENPWHSRWSDERTFNTALGDAPWAPSLYTPGGIWQYSGLDVELMPAFSWESAKNADGYQFVLSDNAEFASPLVDTKTTASAYNLDFELEYNSNYFWKVMAYNGSKAISRWSDIGAFTTISEPAPAPASPAPPVTVTQPASAPVVIPTPLPPVLLWTIVGIGALLIIAVVVLIVRTRRAV